MNSIEQTHYVPTEAELRRFDLMGGVMVAIMILGPLLAGAFRG